MTAAALGSVYFFRKWLGLGKRVKGQGLSKEESQKWHWFVISLILAAVALLLKPFAVFFLLPLGILAIQKLGVRFVLNWRLWVFAVLSITPLLLWRMWIAQFPEGIPASSWLFNGNGIRFRPAFFRWLGYERLIKLISGYVGVGFLLLGFIQFMRERKYVLVGSYMVGCLLYVSIVATGNVQHDYYQIPLMPTIAMLMGLGGYHLLTKLGSRVGLVVCAVLFFLSWCFSWQSVKGYFYVNNPSIVIAGKKVDEITPQDAKIVALYNGDTSFLYQTNRQGWPTLQNGLDDLIEKGADYLVFAHPTDEEIRFGSAYKTVAITSDYAIFDLHHKL
jgi:4-amino-4-deoxy-L-arabinose transferase-like glycosyltransferase